MMTDLIEVKIETVAKDVQINEELDAELPGGSENHQHNFELRDSNVHSLNPETCLLYGIDDVPPWYMCIFLGFQVSVFCESRST